MSEVRKKNVFKLFEERLEREGNLDNFLSRARIKAKNNSHSLEKNKKTLMKDYGYKNPEVEYSREEARLERIRLEEVEKHKRIGHAPGEKNASQDYFEEKISTLPIEAPDQAEFNWIRRHPAMVRNENAKNKTASITITVADVFESQAGVAPSSRAVYDLIYWANHPAEFRKTVLASQKKKMEEATISTNKDEILDEGEYEDDLSKVYNMLKSLTETGKCPVCKRSMRGGVLK